MTLKGGAELNDKRDAKRIRITIVPSLVANLPNPELSIELMAGHVLFLLISREGEPLGHGGGRICGETEQRSMGEREVCAKP